MGLLKNDVGRPSNKIIRTRLIIKLTLLLVIIILFFSTIYFINAKFNKLGGSAMQYTKFENCVIDAYNEQNRTSLPYSTKLTDEQLKSIESLTCREIKYVSGIEKLSGLTYLNFDGGIIENGKMNFSNNLKLENIRLSTENLNEVNISKNKKLIIFTLHSVHLKKLDVKNNDELVELYIGNTELSEINLSNNLKLEHLHIYNSELKSIDVSRNKKLTALHLHGNNLKNINLSQNKMLKNLNLLQNELTTIDLSKNTELEWLQLEQTKLKELNVTKNTKLKFLGVYFNNLTKLDLSKNIELETLRISAPGVDSKIVIKKLDLQNTGNLKSGVITNVKEILLPDNSKFQNPNYGERSPKISKKSLKVKCPNMVLAGKEFTCEVNASNANVKVSSSNLSNKYASKIKTTNNKLKFNLKYDKESTVEIRVTKNGYKEYVKKVKILDNKLVLNCPDIAKVNTTFNCVTDLTNVKITASKEGFSGKNLSFITTSSDKTKQLKYNKLGVITVTASKKDYQTITKKVEIVKNDKLELNCPTVARSNEQFKCSTNLPNVNITIGGANALLTDNSITTTYKNKEILVNYNDRLFDIYTPKTTPKITGTDKNGNYVIATITATRNKETVKKQIKIYKGKVSSIVLICPTAAKINQQFKCLTNMEGVKITVGGAKALSTSSTFTTTKQDWSIPIKYKDILFNGTWSIKKDSNGKEYVLAYIKATKNGFSEISKTVKIYK